MWKTGLRVVRGPNWSWANEDGGEGYVGILKEVNASDKTAVVQWDNGNQMQCRVGCLEKYDLRILDNAQIGVIHKNIICDACNSKTILGIRYKCMNCYDFDLCALCYHGDKHELSHSFRRIESPKSVGVNLTPRSTVRRCKLMGIFKGAEVIRGVDWEWGKQDGGQGNLGVVLEIKGWKHKSNRSVAYVQWLHGNTELYRLGHKGYCDVQFVVPSSGGFYYPEHLSILGQTEEQMEFNQILDFIEIQEVQQMENAVDGLKMDTSTGKTESGSDKWTNERLSAMTQLGRMESLYADIIMKYNNDSATVNLMSEFSHVASEFKNNEIVKIWEMIKCMAQLPQISRNEDLIKGRCSKQFIEAMVQNGKKYLENSYKAYMLDMLTLNIAQPRGDIHTLLETYPLVHNFVGLSLEGEYSGLEDGMIGDRPLWPMVFYCIRLGDLAAALFCLQLSPLVFQEITCVLTAKLQASEAPLIRALEENVRSLYRAVVRNATDPFKRAVWSILGGYNELSEVIKTADDFLWFRLSLIQGDVINRYAELQLMILEEHGESHYNAFENPLLYSKLLVLTGQFEAAIDFLFRTETFKISSVHIAIALNEMNVLTLPQNSTVPLISLQPGDPRQVRRLNLALLIKSYVSKFEKHCLNGALHYFSLLKNCTDGEGSNMFEVLVSDLAINTKEYKIIFGQWNDDGTKSLGLIDQFKDACAMLDNVAQTLLNKELYEDVLNMYDAVNNFTGMLTVICPVLSKLAHLEGKQGSLRNILQERACIIEERLSGNINKNIAANLVFSFTKLKGLLSFFDLYRAKQYPEALKELIRLDILPLTLEELDDKVHNTKNFTADLYKVLPDVLLATMTILLAQCDKIKKESVNSINQREFIFDHPDAETHLQCIMKQANCVMNFTERLPPQLVGNIAKRLAQMEILMHSSFKNYSKLNIFL